MASVYLDRDRGQSVEQAAKINDVYLNLSILQLSVSYRSKSFLVHVPFFIYESL